MNEIRAITIFVRAATLGSLRKAAVDQGISPQAASHAVMQLEKEARRAALSSHDAQAEPDRRRPTASA